MIDGGNGLTSWFGCLAKNKLTMFGAHCPFNPLVQLAESKVINNLGNLELVCQETPSVSAEFTAPRPRSGICWRWGRRGSDFGTG